jgi:hypothetical protein
LKLRGQEDPVQERGRKEKGRTFFSFFIQPSSDKAFPGWLNSIVLISGRVSKFLWIR